MGGLRAAVPLRWIPPDTPHGHPLPSAGGSVKSRPTCSRPTLHPVQGRCQLAPRA